MTSTLDTNVAVYAWSPASGKVDRASAVLAEVHFASVQLLNEFALVHRRKLGLDWGVIVARLAVVREAVGMILPIDGAAHDGALRIAERYRLSFYDSLMLSVALIGGARTFYSEDLQHGLIVEDALRIVNPFLPEAA